MKLPFLHKINKKEKKKKQDFFFYINANILRCYDLLLISIDMNMFYVYVD